LKLPVQLVFITTEVVSSNPGRGEEYLIQHYVITFVSDLRKVGCVLWVLRNGAAAGLSEIILPQVKG
jgi:hypothetical protein